MKKRFLAISLFLSFIIVISFPLTAKSLSYRFFELFINKKTAYVDGIPYQLDQPPVTVNGRTMVPLRFITETIGAKDLFYEERPQEKVTFNLPDSSALLLENAQLKDEIVRLKERIKELESPNPPEPEPPQPPQPPEEIDDSLSLYMLDVGQGDSILLKTKNQNILIDAGEKSADCVNILKNLGITKIDLAITTHPHSDHIGGMEDVLRYYPCKKFIYNGLDYNSNAWQSLDNYIDSLNIEEVIGRKGYSFKVDGVNFEIVAPVNPSISDVNNSSIVLKVSAGETDFLLMGDAETEEESEILGNYPFLDCEIMKIGHHGSSTSTTQALLSITTPEVGLISCGLNNSYGHPSRETLSKLEQMLIGIYRTDYNGTIQVDTDGIKYQVKTSSNKKPLPVNPPNPPQNLIGTVKSNSIDLSWSSAIPGTFEITGYKIYKYDTQDYKETLLATTSGSVKTYTDYQVIKGHTYSYSVSAIDNAYPPNESMRSNSILVTMPAEDSGGEEIFVYITDTGKKYHRDGCRYLAKSKIKILLKEAVAQGYTPCSECNPPKLHKKANGNIYVGGLQTLQGLYPCAFASDNKIALLLSFKYLHVDV